jgi:type IV pilus assembly protein PilB
LCDTIGYKGRVGIFELLEITPKLRALLIRQPHFDDIYAQALCDGMKTLAQDGAQKVADGTISLEEFMRVVV